MIRSILDCFAKGKLKEKALGYPMSHLRNGPTSLAQRSNARDAASQSASVSNSAKL
jgi:hypothetical protein